MKERRLRGFSTVVALLCTLGPGAAFAQASPAAVPSPAASAAVVPPTADPAITARAKEWLHRAQTGTIDRSQLDTKMNELLTDALVKQVAAQFGPLGDPTDLTLVDIRTAGGSTGYMYKATFKSASLYWLFALDRAGKVSGLRFLPTS